MPAASRAVADAFICGAGLSLHPSGPPFAPQTASRLPAFTAMAAARLATVTTCARVHRTRALVSASAAGRPPLPPPPPPPRPSPRLRPAATTGLITPFANRPAAMVVMPHAAAALAFRRSLYHGGDLEALLVRWEPASGVFDAAGAVALHLPGWEPGDAGGGGGLWGWCDSPATPQAEALLRLARGVQHWECGSLWVGVGATRRSPPCWTPRAAAPSCGATRRSPAASPTSRARAWRPCSPRCSASRGRRAGWRARSTRRPAPRPCSDRQPSAWLGECLLYTLQGHLASRLAATADQNEGRAGTKLRRRCVCC